MSKSITVKSVSAKSVNVLAAATIAASIAACLTFVIPNANAAPQATSALQQLSAKGDRLPARLWGAACSSRGWPHYEPACQFDLRKSADEARTVRVIALR